MNADMPQLCERLGGLVSGGGVAECVCLRGSLIYRGDNVSVKEPPLSNYPDNYSHVLALLPFCRAPPPNRLDFYNYQLLTISSLAHGEYVALLN